jgi:hypothetical protein
MASTLTVSPAFAASVHRGNIQQIKSRVTSLKSHLDSALRRDFVSRNFMVNSSFVDESADLESLDMGEVEETSATEITIQNALSTAAMRVGNSLFRVDQMDVMINSGAPAVSVNAQAVMLCSEIAGARALVAGSKLRATTSMDAGIYAPGTGEYLSMSQAVDDAQFITQTAGCGF